MSTATRHLVASSSRTVRSSRRRRWNTFSFVRMAHTRQALRYPMEEGVGEFLPPQALATILEWQDGLLSRLNDEVKNTPLAYKSLVQTIIETAPDRTKTLAFNYASLALNNSFFLNCLKPPPEDLDNNEEQIESPLLNNIEKDFKTLEKLRSSVAATANGMSSSGWVWLVTDGQRNLAVLPTFGAGTLLIRSRSRLALPSGLEPNKDGYSGHPPSSSSTSSEAAALGSSTAGSRTAGSVASPSSNMPGVTSPMSGIHSSTPPLNPHTPSRSVHASAALSSDSVSYVWDTPSVLGNAEAAENNAADASVRQSVFRQMGSHLYPLFCVSIHEHAWLSAGYGVCGKEEYISRFWSALDWYSVSKTYEKFLHKHPKTARELS